MSCGLILLLLVASVSANSGLCPSVCICKWKGGKQAVDCLDRGLITIPDSIEPATQVLDVSGNNLQILPRDTFVRINLLNLQRLYIRSCKLGQIDPQALRGLKNLVELDLSYNLLTSIPSSTFEDVPFLRDLTLAHNPIQKIESYAFQTVPNLIKLDLSHCQLQFIAPKAFEGAVILETLKLNGNRLRELRPKTVERLRNLRGVEMHDNPWVCDCHLRDAKLHLTGFGYPISPTCMGGPDRVLGRNFNELDVDDFACKPEIRLDSRYVEATTGDNATVVCRVESIPTAHVSWYWNGRHLANNSAFSSYQKVFIVETGHFEKKSVLILTNAQESDSGEFNCIAENRAGNVEANYTLHVTQRIAGMATLGSGQIAGLSAALVILILFILLVILVMLVRLRRTSSVDTKTPNQIEAIPNGNAGCSAKTTSPVTIDNAGFTEKKTVPSELSLNPIQKPPRSEVPPYPINYCGSMVNPQYVNPASNPDLINDMRRPDDDDASLQQRPSSGEYSRANDSLYPSGLWDQGIPSELQRTSSTNFGYDSNDKTPIIDGASAEDDYSRALEGYPSDYGLPILPTASSPGVSPTNPPHPSAKTLRVWQRGVPVLPPVTALKRVLSRNSPDEGYQEGCGTDV